MPRDPKGPIRYNDICCVALLATEAIQRLAELCPLSRQQWCCALTTQWTVLAVVLVVVPIDIGSSEMQI